MDTIEASSAREAILSLEEVGLQFQIESDIAKLLVKNNILYIVLTAGLIYRIDLDNPETVDQLRINSTNFISNAYLDDNGYHLIVQTSRNEFFYLNILSTTFKTLGKLRNIPISSILFVDDGKIGQSSTGAILISTLTGLIYEYSVQSNKEKSFKQIWKSRESISGISGGLVREKENPVPHYNIHVHIGEANKLLQFTSSELSNCFKKDPLVYSFYSLLHFTSNSTSLAFLDTNEEEGIYQICYGKLNFKTKNELNYLKIDQQTAAGIGSILLTKYHLLLLLNSNELIIYNQLNGLETASTKFDGDQFIQFANDDKYETYWLHSAAAIYEILLNDENSDIWKIMVKGKLPF
ncbi:unnamed protein product [Ambrosiozyma monospora]|uniref:Unnamed protein product n=1 Tax=Ambrosiozyma monospora TaxID=43982 RepID=A0ACB5SVB1_AMBMO|nr:unnamed protein product [Ambrosiozyma monospora]